MAIEDYYRDLTAQTPKRTVDEYGDAVNTLGTPRSFRGYIGKPTSAQQYRACQLGIDVSGRLYAEPGAAVVRYDVITDERGNSWQVHGAPRDAAGRGHHIEADLVEWRW